MDGDTEVLGLPPVVQSLDGNDDKLGWAEEDGWR